MIGIEEDKNVTREGPPKLILTSPPYPGVHVLYHRWQIFGRRETPAPFWIAGCTDGTGAAFYTFGHRRNVRGYYRQMRGAYNSLAAVSGEETLLVQLIAFSKPDIQLNKHLEVLETAGFKEIRACEVSNSRDGRLWRQVPNRRWYAYNSDIAPASQEVVLFHRLK
jgi:hypothetical protein